MAKKEYRALTGLNYVPEGAEKDEEGNWPEVRVEAGDKITDMKENALRHELAAKNVEEWQDRDTSNVRKPEEEEPQLDGVRSRHANEGQDIVLKGLSENGD